MCKWGTGRRIRVGVAKKFREGVGGDRYEAVCTEEHQNLHVILIMAGF